MENLLRVDFESNRVERTRTEWINELIEYEIDCLDCVDNNDATLTYLLTNGFVGYKNMSDIALIDEIYETLGHNYHIEEYITEAI
jgi:hypothetical protein